MMCVAECGHTVPPIDWRAYERVASPTDDEGDPLAWAETGHAASETLDQKRLKTSTCVRLIEVIVGIVRITLASRNPTTIHRISLV
jgi:hypothetical protein